MLDLKSLFYGRALAIFMMMCSGNAVIAQEPDKGYVDIVWSSEAKVKSGEIRVRNGNVRSLLWVGTKGSVKGARFTRHTNAPARLRIALSDMNVKPGPLPTLVTVLSNEHS